MGGASARRLTFETPDPLPSGRELPGGVPQGFVVPSFGPGAKADPTPPRIGRGRIAECGQFGCWGQAQSEASATQLPLRSEAGGALSLRANGSCRTSVASRCAALAMARVGVWAARPWSRDREARALDVPSELCGSPSGSVWSLPAP